MGNQIIIPHSEAVGGPQTLNIGCDASHISDGFHTFGELYEHRHVLFCALAHAVWVFNIGHSWKSSNHWIAGELESVWPGWFLAGIALYGQQITYHLPLTYWDLFHGRNRDTPPEHDGHTSADVIERLKEWIKS
jgi:hypothetical protein